jgi:signal transduction histidine kinase
LRQLVNRFRRLHPVRVKLHLARLGSVPQSTEIIVYRLVQECSNNIGKHSGATVVNISVSSADGLVRLSVEDNGVGFDVEEALARRDSFGLSGMRERVALLGGRFEVQSHPRGDCDPGQSKRKGTNRRRFRQGTRISITLPLADEMGRREGPAAQRGIKLQVKVAVRASARRRVAAG